MRGGGWLQWMAWLCVRTLVGVVVFRLWVWAGVLRLCLTLRLGLVVVGRWHRWVVLVLYVSVTCLRTAGVARVGVAFECRAVGVAIWGVRLWAPPLNQTGSGWPFSVPRCAARPASAEADA